MKYKSYILILTILCIVLPLNTLAGENNSKPLIYLDQNWSNEERQSFYSTPQGSYLIPLKWYVYLEQPRNKKPFSQPKHIRKFGYLNTSRLAGNLPVGFAVEPLDNAEPWIGYTCAACHTNNITYKGNSFRIDGAPALADFSGFVNSLLLSVRETISNDEKFTRFAYKVLGHGLRYDSMAFEQLREELLTYEEKLGGFVSRNKTNHEYGYARLDALGMLMNEVFGDDLLQPVNIREPNASVSYAHLWGTPSHDWVQWNGSAANPIQRSIAEVLGSFGSIDLFSTTSFGKNSARAKQLFELERLVVKLTSPAWPQEHFGAINEEKAVSGRVLYEQFRDNEPSCAYCHALRDESGQYPLTPADENLFGVQFVETHMTPLEDIGTDTLTALNFATSTVSTGHLSGLLPAPFTGATELPYPVMLAIVVGIATENSIQSIEPPLNEAELAEIIGYRIAAEGYPPYRPKNLLAYRARPLDGIWATAPFLHNGSVVSLYELLLSSDQRQKVFYVGSRKFDPKNVGFEPWRTKNSSKFDVNLPGNSNAGHEYGVTLGEDEKWDLIEFLKTL